MIPVVPKAEADPSPGDPIRPLDVPPVAAANLPLTRLGDARGADAPPFVVLTAPGSAKFAPFSPKPLGEFIAEPGPISPNVKRKGERIWLGTWP